MNILKKVYLTIETCDLVRPGETVVLGVSGGADSVALVRLLCDLEKLQQHGWKLHIAHVNHQLRGKEADEDEKFVKKFAKSLDLPFSSRRVDVKALKDAQHLSLEEAARKGRHEALQDIAVAAGANKIALAHTLDDQSETILHRIIRGASLRGIKGMAPIRLLSRKHDLFVIRPMLELERSEVRRYLEERKVAWREDSSNADVSYMRNRLRLELIPQIERMYNPRFKYALVKLGQTAAAFYLLVREIAFEMYENVKLIGKEGEVCLSAKEFAKLPIPVQTLIVDRAMKELQGRMPQLTFEHYMDIISLCADDGQPRTLMLPKGVEATRESYVLKLYRPQPQEKPFKFGVQKIKVPGRTLIKKLNLSIEAELLEGKVVGLADYVESKDASEEIIDCDRVEGGLFVRMRKIGDQFRPLGSQGSTKLKKFFIDTKIPKQLRDRVPILSDDKKIICVVGYRIGDDVKVTEATRRILKLRFRKL